MWKNHVYWCCASMFHRQLLIISRGGEFHVPYPSKKIYGHLRHYLSKSQGKGELHAWARLPDPPEKELWLHNETRNIDTRR